MIDNLNLTAVIPFYEGHSTIHRLVTSLPENLPIIIVDDRSKETISQENINKKYNLEGRNSVKIIRLEEKGYFAGAVNRGIQECSTDVLVLNQDVWFENSEWLGLIEQYRDRFAFIGERIRGDHPSFGELGYIHGTFMFMRRDAIRSVGLLNNNDYPLWGNTAEWQWRAARKNYQVLPLKEIPGFHHDRPDNQKYGNSISELLEKNKDKKDLLIRTPPLLSVIVPCYNYGRYIQDCINSLIGGPTSLGDMPGQTLQSFEIIIVDDASTDNSAEYIKQVTDISKGIRAYRLNRNSGTANALNYGIERAVGKYITFLSADDMREDFSLKKLVETCEQNPHSFAYDDVWLVNKHKRVKKWKIEEYDFDTLIWKNQIHAGIVYPKEAWKEVGGYPSIMNDGREDWAFNVALGVYGWCGVHVEEYGYLYRREGQNRTERNTTERHRQEFLGKIMSVFPGIYRGERTMACCGSGGSKSKTASVSRSTTFSTGGSAKMASQIGSEGMVKIEYLGNQMSSTWPGDVTGVNYTFGKDRVRGWIDKRDLGSMEERKGFLSKKDRNTGAVLFRIATDSKQKVEGVQINSDKIKSEIEQNTGLEDTKKVFVESGLTPESWSEPDTSLVKSTSEVTGTLSSDDKKKDVFEYDPSALSVEEIKKLVNKNLSQKQWQEVYKRELANRNRKGAVSFLEEVLADFSEEK